MTAWQWLAKEIPRQWLPLSTEIPCKNPSNSEIRRWLERGSILINGKKPGPDDGISFPIDELVFFWKSPRRKTTWK